MKCATTVALFSPHTWGRPTAEERAAAGRTTLVGILARMAAGALLPRPAAAAWPPSVVGGSGCVGSAIVVAMPPGEGEMSKVLGYFHVQHFLALLCEAIH